MKLDIHNWELLQEVSPKFSISLKNLKEALKEQFFEYNLFQVGIVCVNSEYIHRLNLEYRKKNYVTDVLSFNLDTEPLVAEVYICPEYIFSNTKPSLFEEEIVRNMVHGLLHIVGYDHGEDMEKTEMFVKQEDIVKKIFNTL